METKKKFNKKKLLTFGILGVFALALASAGILTYYGYFQQEISVQNPITVSPTTSGIIDNVWAGIGGVEKGDLVTISNAAPFDVDVDVNNNAPEGIEVSYLKSMDMETKNSDWVITGVGAVLYYTTIGNNFVYKVTQTDAQKAVMNLTNYVVVYYPDSTGNPGPWNIGSAVIVGNVTSNLTVSKTISEGLPFETDFNKEAKLWLMPREDVENETWNISTILFEHELITYTDAEEGTLTIPAEGSVELTPVYVIAQDYLGNPTITTYAKPVVA